MDKTKTKLISLSRKYQLIRVKRKTKKMMTAEKADRFRRIGLIK
jgi:hypothetical protein